MKKRLHFTRFIVALALTGLIGLQVPSVSNLAFAQSNYPPIIDGFIGTGGDFKNANLAGGIMAVAFAGALIYSLTTGDRDEDDNGQASAMPVDIGVRAVVRN